MEQQGEAQERKPRRRIRSRPPIINVGRLRIDWPTRDRSPANLVKFALFIAVLLGLFALLYVVQFNILTSMNSRQQTPDWKSIGRGP